jgi:hypothetical protein
MREGQVNAGRHVLVPRALAVISCALALLAAQPVAARSAAPGLRDAPLVTPASVAATPAADPRRAGQSRPATGGPRADRTLFQSARRLHILATVEILKRLLIAELHPVERAYMPALAFEPLACVWAEPAVLVVPGRVGLPAFPSLPPPEQHFVRLHTQLAPPLV